MSKASSNLGATTLRRHTRAVDPMRLYDSLPPDLRHWMAEAALPWSPTSCLKLWRKARAEGASTADALARLNRAEAQMLARERAA